MTGVRLRVITPADLDLVCRHREEMFRDAGVEESVLSAMRAPFRCWLAPRLGDGRYFGLVAVSGGEVVGGVGVMAIEWPPHPYHALDDRRGYVLNVYVEPGQRGRGLGRMLMRAAEEEMRARGIGYAVLHATAAGQPLYGAMGWEGTAEMAKSLDL